jgi:hypothetical protein
VSDVNEDPVKRMVDMLDEARGTPAGTRVGAILSMARGEVKLLGYGVYEGNQYPDGSKVVNARIRLDSGDVVWGYQCWWGKEDEVAAAVQRQVEAGAVVRHVRLVNGAEMPAEAL